LVKVADLGLARLSGAAQAAAGGNSLTQAGGVLGTVDFMPPEQALDSTTIDHRADIYSLGCTLFFLLTGRPLYSGNSMMAVLLMHRDGPIPSLAAVRPEVPAELDAILQRAIAKKAVDRYPSMTEMIGALEAIERVTRTLTVRPVHAAASTPSPTDHTVAFSSAAPTSPDTPCASVSQDTGPAPTIVAARPTSDLTVVLVEPSRTQAGIVRRYLQQLGIDKVHTIGAGSQAIALAKETQAHVLLSTMHLSDMTGLELARTLRADPTCADIGFILASSESESDPTGEFVRNPRSVLMPKPFDLHKLSQALAQATGREPESIRAG
jgi:serine/threonine protein kinase